MICVAFFLCSCLKNKPDNDPTTNSLSDSVDSYFDSYVVTPLDCDYIFGCDYFDEYYYVISCQNTGDIVRDGSYESSLFTYSIQKFNYETPIHTVIHLRNGKYGLAEIKLGGQRLIEEGVTNLKKLYEKIDTTKMPAPSFMMIVVGTGDFAYRREDGIYIVPIGCLKN